MRNLETAGHKYVQIFRPVLPLLEHIIVQAYAITTLEQTHQTLPISVHKPKLQRE